MPTIFITTEHDSLSYDVSPGADLCPLLPLLAEDLGEAEDVIRLYLHGNRVYPGTALINGQTYELVIARVEHILLRAKQRGEEWYVEQVPFDTEEPLPLSRCHSGRYSIRHNEELRYVCDTASFAAVMEKKGLLDPTRDEIEHFMADHIEFLPGDFVDHQ